MKLLASFLRCWRCWAWLVLCVVPFAKILYDTPSCGAAITAVGGGWFLWRLFHHRTVREAEIEYVGHSG